MTRSQLAHLVRAAGRIANDREIIIIGSQSIHGAFNTIRDKTLIQSNEADFIPNNSPEKWNEIDGALGDGSPFFESFGIMAQGVGVETAILPSGWRDRLIRFENAETEGYVGLCLEPHDLAVSKYAADRPKDHRFTAALVREGFVNQETLVERAQSLPISDAQKERIIAYIGRDFALKLKPPEQGTSFSY